MTEGQLWCPEHGEYDDDDLADGFVTEITQFDIDCATPQADWLKGGCCAGCGTTFPGFVDQPRNDPDFEFATHKEEDDDES